MQLINEKYYFQEYNGNVIPMNSFEKYAKNASGRVNYYTFNRLCDESIITDEVRNAACEIAELLYTQDNLKSKIQENILNNQIVASETLGPSSKSYVNNSNSQKDLILSDETKEQKIYQICYRHLIHTGLMYRGFNE